MHQIVHPIRPGSLTSWDKRSGVTLIELLIVASILVIVIGVIASAVSAGIAVWDTARNFDARRIEALIWIETLEMELRSSLSLHAIATKCDESVIAFPALIRDETVGDKGAICEIRYSFDSDTGRITRRARGFPFAVRGGDQNDMVMVSNVKNMNVHGVFVSDEMEEGSDSRQLTSVKVVVVIGEGKDRVDIQRTIHLPVQPEKDSDSVEDET